MDITKLKDRITIDLSYLDLLTLTANLDLSLRHKDNSGPGSQLARIMGKLFLTLLIQHEINIPKEVIDTYNETFNA